MVVEDNISATLVLIVAFSQINALADHTRKDSDSCFHGMQITNRQKVHQFQLCKVRAKLMTIDSSAVANVPCQHRILKLDQRLQEYKCNHKHSD